MVILLLALIIGFIVGIVIEELIEIGFFAVLGGAIAGIVFFFGMLYAIDQNVEKVTKRDVTELVALSNGSETGGVMFLGSGYINDELTYKYAYKKVEGYAVDAERADRIEEIRYIKDRSKPRIERTETVHKATWANFLTAPFFETHKYVYVPKGTIQETFKIDLEK